MSISNKTIFRDIGSRQVSLTCPPDYLRVLPQSIQAEIMLVVLGVFGQIEVDHREVIEASYSIVSHEEQRLLKRFFQEKYWEAQGINLH